MLQNSRVKAFTASELLRENHQRGQRVKLPPPPPLPPPPHTHTHRLGLNSNPNNLFEILFVMVFLVDILICLNILLTVLKISKSSLSGSILINLQPSSCSIAFSLFSHYFCHYVRFHQFLVQAYSHENMSQSYILKHYIAFAYFLFQMNSLFLLALIVILFK